MIGNMYNCFDISKEFLRLASQEGKGVDTMKLLKLTYIAHGYYLGFFDRSLFSNKVEAWKYGPVIPELYGVIKRFRSMAVDIELVDLYSEHEVSQEDREFLASMWQSYKHLSGRELSALTHQPGSPWDQVYIKDQYNLVIPNEIIKNYYLTKIEKWSDGLAA